jgi:hypothetical protein
LDREAASAFEHHLHACAECQTALRDFAALGHLLREAYDEHPAPELRARFARAALDRREQSPRRIALGLLAAASILFVSSLFLVVYTESGNGQGDSVMAQWEENVVWAPSADDEFADPESATLYAIHLQAGGAREYGDE